MVCTWTIVSPSKTELTVEYIGKKPPAINANSNEKRKNQPNISVANTLVCLVLVLSIGEYSRGCTQTGIDLKNSGINCMFN